MPRNLSTAFFYLGTFITSFGSLLFVMAIPAFFLKAGYTPETIGLAIGIHRFSGIAASAWFSPSIDRLNSRRVIFFTEFLAAFSSLGLIAAWRYREAVGVFPFLIFVGIRALIMGVQSSSRSRLIKLLSSENQDREASFAIWLNKATQGAHVLSALVAIPLVASGNLFVAIAIDGASFLVGGYAALMLPDLDSGEKHAGQPSNIVRSIIALAKMHRFVFLQDQFLALAVSGTILLMVKLSGGDSGRVIYFNVLFGICIWVSSVFAHNVNLRSHTVAYWLTLFLGYLLLTVSHQTVWCYGAYVLTYMSYWILYHKYTVEIQTKTPKELIGATMAARGLAMAVTLSVGELLGGHIARIFDLGVELGIRTGFCFVVAAGLAYAKFKSTSRVVARALTIGAMLTIMTTNAKATGDGELRIAMPTKHLQLDPQKIEDMYSMTIVNQLYAKLFRYTPDGQIRPDLVERWAVSKDKTIYTFQLKRRTFSDGTPITARHIANSLKRVFVVKAALSSDLSIIKGARSFARTKSSADLAIRALDDQTLQIETEKPTSLLIYLMAVPDVGVLKLDDPAETASFDAASPFSGPYKITRATDDRIAIQKWRTSDLESSNPPRDIEINLFKSVDPLLVASGKITDTSSFMTFDEGRSPLENSDGWRAVASEGANERFIVMNPAKIPANVRRWMLARVSTEDFVKTLDDKSIVPAFGFIPHCLPGHLKSPEPRRSSSLSLDKPLTIKITYGSNLPYADKFKSYLSRAWAHSSLTLEFEALPVSEYLEVLFQKKGAVVIGASGLDYPEGYSVVSYFRSDIESNFYFVNSKAIDKLIDAAAHEVDGEKRKTIYETIQKSVLREATVIPLAFGSWKKYFWSNRVSAVPAHPIGIHFMPLEMLTMATR